MDGKTEGVQTRFILHAFDENCSNVRQENGLYRRFDEEHVQRAHEAEELVGALRQAGFENIETFSGLTDQPARPDDARIHFRAVKPDGREK